MLPHILTFLFVIGGMFYGLKYTERAHLRIKFRRFGLLINSYIISHKTAQKLMHFVSHYFLMQLVSFLEITLGFIEGIIEMKPLY